MTRKSWTAVTLTAIAVFAVLVCAFCLVVLEVPHELHTRAYWLLGSRAYKREVLASNRTSAELQHVTWQGDGWGGVPVGDWMGYVVYDPSDSLPLTSTDRPPMRFPGIPCEVVAVRRLEKNWYSVVTNMNQFWDTLHPNCRSRYEQ